MMAAGRRLAAVVVALPLLAGCTGDQPASAGRRTTVGATLVRSRAASPAR